jgi:short-subunit dehydrogenase
MKASFITGAGSGLGRELALLYSKEYEVVLLSGRNLHNLEETKRLIEENGGQALCIQGDLSKIDEFLSKLSELPQEIEIVQLINNAGLGRFGAILESSKKDYLDMFQTNVFAAIEMTKQFLPSMINRHEGHIINIVSTAGLRGKVNESLYAASKFALRGFTESLQKELANTGVHVTAAYMGGMNTPFWSETNHVEVPEKFRSPKEVAQLIFDTADKELEIIIESKK